MTTEELGILVTFNPSTVSADMTIEEFLEQIESSPFHHWPVVDDELRLLGIISDEDIIQAVGERAAVNAAEGVARFPCDHDRCLISDWMTRQTVTVTLETPPAEALRLMLDHGFHSLPVVREGRLVAMLTSTDFLREFSYGDHPVCRQPVSRCMINTTDYLETNVSLDEAKFRMELAETDYLPVLQGECPLGVISRRELRINKCRELTAQALRRAERLPTRMSGLVMATPTLRPGDHIARAAGLMVEHRVQAITVVNHGNHLLGIVCEEGILQAMTEYCHG